MNGTGIHHIYVETRSWAESVKFWAALGFEPHPNYSGPPDGVMRPLVGGPYIYLREVPANRRDLEFAVAFGADDLDDLVATDGVRVIRQPYETSWGATFAHLVDPDGREIQVRRSDQT